MRKVLIVILLGLVGCDKFSRKSDQVTAVDSAVSERPSEKKAQEKRAEDPAYAKNYELAKARAVSEFPALGVAGSPLNAAFVARANRMKETNADDLSSPEWPYKLALKVNEEQGKARAALYKPGSVLTVADLQNLRPTPAGACVSGQITQAFGGRTAEITLDNTLKCEISDPVTGSGSAEVLWVREGNLIVLKSRVVNTQNYNVIKSFAIGQRVTFEGGFTPAGTTKKLIGVVRN